PGALGGAEPADLRRRDADADDDHPVRGGPALPAGAGAAPVHGAEAAGRAGGGADVSRRGARHVPVGAAEPPAGAVRGGPGVVGTPPVTGPADLRGDEERE